MTVTITPTIPADFSALEPIRLQMSEYFAKLSGEAIQYPKPIESVLSGSSLPPNGKLENFELLTIYANDSIVGFAETYYGYPNEQTAYIGLLYLAKRGKGYGTEAVGQLLNRFRLAGYSRVGLGVLLCNACGLRFWHKQGFDRITGVNAETKTVGLVKKI
ncbi:hypothetical protein FACS1894111_08470 [Clostridia bacterium]|nr:hypothetical protein FACS1894111_08470 [Clostridia bacterium]